MIIKIYHHAFSNNVRVKMSLPLIDYSWISKDSKCFLHVARVKIWNKESKLNILSLNDKSFCLELNKTGQ